MMNIHCLVQVNGNELDFAEWLDYHIALGFDAIFVFNNGNHNWLNAVCERRADKNVVVVPGDEDWSHQSTIIQKFVARRKQPSWAICLSDDEFIWLDPKFYRNIKDFVFGECDRRGATACTLYTKHISSKEPMKSRVGTQIDCFTHIRREPEGYLPALEVCPNTGATFFKITSPEMPLVDKLTPRNPSRWMDGNGNRLLPEELGHYIHSKEFFPMRYRARIYRFCPKSGFEMSFADNAVPKGFDIQDLSMQEARSLLMRVPVNPDTENLFAKDIIPEAPAVVENSNGTTSEISKEELAERELPVSKARICKMILAGKYFEDIRDELQKQYQDIDVEALVLIAVILDIKSHAVVFEMPENKYLPAFLCDSHADAGFIRIGENGKLRMIAYKLGIDCRMPAVRNIEYIIKTAYERFLSFMYPVLKNTEHLLVKRLLIDTVMIIDPGLCTPADMQGRSNVILGPFHYLTEFIPVRHLFKFHLLDRSAGYDHSVIFALHHFIGCDIKLV